MIGRILNTFLRYLFMTLLIVFQVKCYFFVVLCPAFLTANTWDFIGIDSKCFYLPSKNENFRNNFLLGPGVHTRLKWRENVLGVIQYGSPFKNPIFSTLLPSYHYLSLSMATPPLSCHYYQTQLFRKRKNTIFVLC